MNCQFTFPYTEPSSGYRVLRSPFARAFASRARDPILSVAAQLNSELGRWLNGAVQEPTEGGVALANFQVGEGFAVLTMQVPGATAEAIDLEVVGKVLTIKGNWSAAKVNSELKRVRAELPSGSFARSFELPFDVQVDKVEATFRKGVLTVTLPQLEAQKPRKIQFHQGS